MHLSSMKTAQCIIYIYEQINKYIYNYIGRQKYYILLNIWKKKIKF